MTFENEWQSFKEGFKEGWTQFWWPLKQLWSWLFARRGE